jgi:hypothetical protein
MRGAIIFQPAGKRCHGELRVWASIINNVCTVVTTPCTHCGQGHFVLRIALLHTIQHCTWTPSSTLWSCLSFEKLMCKQSSWTCTIGHAWPTSMESMQCKNQKMIMCYFRIRLRFEYNTRMQRFWNTVMATQRQAIIMWNECLLAVRTCPTSRNWFLHNKYKLLLACLHQRAVTHNKDNAITFILCPNRNCVRTQKFKLTCSKHFEHFIETMIIDLHQNHDTWLFS